MSVTFAPYLLDPTVPPEGKPRKPQTQPNDPPTYLEQRAAQAGLAMERGRTKTSYSIPSLEAGEFAREHGRALEFHWKMFEAYFANLEDIGDHDVIVRAGEAAGLPGDELRKALEEGTYHQQVLDGIEWSRAIGVTGVPTFIFEEQWAIVGAQDYNVFQSIMSKLGQEPSANGHE